MGRSQPSAGLRQPRGAQQTAGQCHVLTVRPDRHPRSHTALHVYTVYIHMHIQVHVYLWVQGLHRVSYVSSLPLKSTAYQLASLLWGLLVCGFHTLQLQAGLLTPIMAEGPALSPNCATLEAHVGFSWRLAGLGIYRAQNKLA